MKRNSNINFLVSLVVLTFLMVCFVLFIPNKALAAEKLSAPSNVRWSSTFGKCYWNSVYDADEYQVKINGYTLTVDDNNTNLKDYLKFGQKNYFQVKAVSDSSDYTDSSYTKSDPLDLRKDSYLWRKYHDEDDDDDDDDDKYIVYPNTYYNVSTYYYNNGGYPYVINPWYSYQQPTLKGWQYIGGAWYYFTDSGSMVTSKWLYSNNKNYYFNEYGQMVVGWQKIKGSWYYFDGSGAMQKNTTIKSADGQFDYQIGSDGKWLTNRWQYNAKGWYYIGSDSVLKNSELSYKGKNYYLDANGYMVANSWKQVSGKWYYYNPDGTRCDFISYYNGHYYAFNPQGVLISMM